MIIHQVYTGGKFGYDFYISVMTAIYVHKYEEYILWILDLPEDRHYYDLIEAYAAANERISIRQVEFDFLENVRSYEDWKNLPAMRGKDDNFQRVTFKDVFEIGTLLKYGGLFMDLDTVSIHDVSRLYSEVSNFGTFELIVPHPDDYNMAVIMAVRDSPFLRRFMSEVSVILDREAFKWGDVGPNLLNHLLQTERPTDFWQGEFAVADGHGDGKIVDWFGDNGYVWRKCRVLHTYRSCPYSAPYKELISPEWVDQSTSPYARLVKAVLPDAIWNPFTDQKAIPSRMHLIYIGGPFHYLYYISILSALHVHKFKQFFLWILKDREPVENQYYQLLEGNPRLNIRFFDYDAIPGASSFDDWKSLPAFDDWQQKNNWTPEFTDRAVLCHIKDYVSYKILYDYGGLYLDMDTLSIRDCAAFTTTEVEAIFFEDIVPHPGFYTIGTFFSNYQSDLIQTMMERWVEASQKPGEWAWSGAHILMPLLKEYEEAEKADRVGLVHEVSIVGGLSARYKDYFDDDGFVYDGNMIMHLYASTRTSIPIIQHMTPEWIFRSQSPFAKAVKSILQTNIWNPFLVKQPKGTVGRVKTFHVLGLSMLPTNREESLSCAYTQKVWKLCEMLKSLGHKVYFYGIEGSTARCDEFIQCSTRYQLQQSYGRREDMNKYHNLDHSQATAEFDENAIREINKRKSPKDFLLCMFGWGHKAIADGVQLRLTIEPGIGYKDTFAPFRVFESYTWMSFVYGRQNNDNGKNYDTVIPNYFNPEDFEYKQEKEDYILFIGRLIQRKGIELAIQVTAAAGKKLIVAGQHCGGNINLDRENVEYVGYIGVEERKRLLSNAQALIVPTQYQPPFEGVHIEAAFSGTPVITSDWGCFGETVIPGITGYRCTTFDDYIWAIENIDKIDPYNCYTYALNNYSTDRLKWRYEEYWDKLLDLIEGGWYTRHPERSSMDLLTRQY